MKISRPVWSRVVALGLVVGFFAVSANAENQRTKRWREENRRIEAIQSISEVWEIVLAGGQHSAFRALDRLSEELRDEPEKTEEAVEVLRKVRLHLAEVPEADEARVLLCRLRTILGAPAEPVIDSSTTPSMYHPKSGIQKPRRIYDPHPQYTVSARKSRVQGVVVSQLTIDPEGCVDSVSILQSLHPGLDEATRRTQLTWVYLPAQLDGKNVMIYYKLTTHFQLQ